MDATPWHRLPADLAAAMRPRLPSAARTITDAVAATTPAFADGTYLDRDVRAPVQVALERFADLAGTDEPALPPRIREVFVALGAAEARENRGPELLLGALRTASRLMLRLASEALAGLRPVTVDELIDLTDAVSAYVDELAAACTDGLTRQLREQAGEGERRRRQVADLLLRGGGQTTTVRDAAAAIGWPALDTLVPVLFPLEHARDVRFRFGGDGLVAERAADAVLLIRTGPRAERAVLTEALTGRDAVVGPAAAWAVLPEAVALTERAAALAGTGPAPVFADDHLTALVLRGVPGALSTLRARRLAPLDGLTQARRAQLLRTLESWLRHWGSRTAVAAELFVHPQTVSYRLGRLRDAFGDDLDDPVIRFELQLVLAAG
ncbi:PucR family transcriptional regulator [Catenuloplanes indicus]|uniref:PucR family transcriptional regulator n=1 Tax=Catenuloplanes indicus TaxID=137267 RepID=A0AAE3VWD5_9ACTN|nr:PucR family transcriptional regulator [Catenuloplanes indicus]MDQ0365228.1 hypothetical protein [Catenuloplanes indicus]